MNEYVSVCVCVRACVRGCLSQSVSQSISECVFHSILSLLRTYGWVKASSGRFYLEFVYRSQLHCKTFKGLGNPDVIEISLNLLCFACHKVCCIE